MSIRFSAGLAAVGLLTISAGLRAQVFNPVVTIKPPAMPQSNPPLSVPQPPQPSLWIWDFIPLGGVVVPQHPNIAQQLVEENGTALPLTTHVITRWGASPTLSTLAMKGDAVLNVEGRDLIITNLRASQALRFATTPPPPAAANETERMRISSEGTVAINQTNPNTLAQLQVSNGTVLFDGANGTAVGTPASGPGTRFMWIPQKAALRAGAAYAFEWDDSNIGTGSVALGISNSATKVGTVSLGYDNRVEGDYSTALGWNNYVTDRTSAAVGAGNDVTGITASAIGSLNDAAGDESAALGTGCRSNHYRQIVVGSYNVPFYTSATGTWYEDTPIFTVANGSDATHRSDALTILKNGKTGIGTQEPRALMEIAGGGLLCSGDIGSTPVSGDGTRLMWIPAKGAFRAGAISGSIAWNDGNIGRYSFAAGYNTEASAAGAISMGNGTVASEVSATALGLNTTASRAYATAMNVGTTASGLASTSMGGYTVASGDDAVSMGWYTTAQSYLSLVIGRYNNISGSTDNWISSEPLFVAGNGSSAGATGNALTLYKDGDMTIAGTLTQNSDLRLKKDLVPVTNVLEKLKNIQPVYYYFNDTERHPAEHQLGFVAQEIEAAWPELVRSDENGYLSVAYGNMSAVAVQAIREQQVIIETLRVENAEMKGRIERLESAMAGLVGEANAAKHDAASLDGLSSPGKESAVLLYQNDPNPFDERTRIGYFLPSSVDRAELIVYQSASGGEVRRITVEGRGHGEVVITGSDLASGTYYYLLLADGVTTPGRSMIVVR